jgi:AraC-like DNA-binding protein
MAEHILYRSQLVEVGRFELHPDEPRFNETGHVAAPIVVFPGNSIWIQHAGSQAFVADTTVVNFYNQGQVYHRQAIDPQGDHCHWFRLADASLAELVNREQQHFTREYSLCPVPVYLAQLQVLNLIKQPKPDHLSIDAAVFSLFNDLLGQSTGHQSANLRCATQHRRLTESVKESLQQEPGVNLSLQALAKRHGTSPHHLCRVFRRVNGLGINQYRTQQRLRALLLNMQSGGEALTRLALDHGFSSHAHMSARFRACFGMTPSACRQWLGAH